MLEIQDSALLLSAKLFSENDFIISVLTAAHGRYDGLVKGGNSRKKRGDLQLGNALAVTWRAKTAEQLGYFSSELITNYSAPLLESHGRLLALRAACALLVALLPERLPYPTLYQATQNLFAQLRDTDWAVHYLRWEVTLLAEFGFGLDLTRCAMTGETDNLAYVSPKTGRAATALGAKGFEQQCLILPAFLVRDDASITHNDIQAGFTLTDYFLESHLQDLRGTAARELRFQLQQVALKI